MTNFTERNVKDHHRKLVEASKTTNNRITSYEQIQKARHNDQ